MDLKFKKYKHNLIIKSLFDKILDGDFEVERLKFLNNIEEELEMKDNVLNLSF